MVDEKQPENPKPVVVGRTWADLMATSETGPKLDAAMARVVDFFVNTSAGARERIARLFRRVDAQLEASGVEPKAIPERVALPVLEAASLEERDEIHDLWARLLAGAASGHEVDQFHINLVRQLNADAARVIVAARTAAFRFQLTRHTTGRVADDISELDLRELPEVHSAIPDEKRREAAVGRLIALGLMYLRPTDAFGRVDGVVYPSQAGGELMLILMPGDPDRRPPT